MSKSWRTTAFGILTILGALATEGRYLLDADPDTMPNMAVITVAITAGWGFIVAKDEKNS